MGSPRTSKKKKTPNVHHFLAELGIEEKISLFKLASSMKAVANIPNITAIFEGIKEVLLPIVRWLDKPLSSWAGFQGDYAAHGSLEHHRALLVYDGFGAGTLSLALDREGMWIVNLFRIRGEKIRRVDSVGFAELLIARIDDMVRTALSWKVNEHWEFSSEELGFLDDIFRYAKLLEFVSNCQKPINEILAKQEQQIRMMRERLAVVDDFAKTLDPLQAGRAASRLPTYAIWHEHDRGVDVSVQSYLTVSALEPFWKYIDGLNGGRKGYSQRESDRFFRTLDGFMSFFADIWGSIQDRPHGAVAGVANSFGSFKAGRLPLTPDEITALRRWAASIQ